METRLYKLSMQRQMVVTNAFYFMFCQYSLLSTVISLYTKTNGGSMKACQLFSVWKIYEKEFFCSLSTLN